MSFKEGDAVRVTQIIPLDGDDLLPDLPTYVGQIGTVIGVGYMIDVAFERGFETAFQYDELEVVHEVP